MNIETAGFMECDTCRGKTGMPLLCTGCLHNRELLSDLHAEVERLRGYLSDLRKEAKEDDLKAWVMVCDEALGGEVDKKKPKPRPDDWNEEYLEMG